MTTIARSALAACALASLAFMQSKTPYTPVAKPDALQPVLLSYLKTTSDWLENEDFLSAAESVQCLALVARLIGYQSEDPKWRETARSLQDATEKLLTACRAKDLNACTTQLAACQGLAEKLPKVLPPLGKAGGSPVRDYQSYGTTKTWMLVMDGTYVDAKAVTSNKELEDLAWALVEEANALTHVRADAKWQKFAREMQAAALETTRAAQSNDLAKAKQVLKNVGIRCEGCHQGFRR